MEFTITQPTAKAEANSVAEPKKRGRKPLPPEERERRRAARAVADRKTQNARRRAMAVLAERYRSEFDELLQSELNKG